MNLLIMTPKDGVVHGPFSAEEIIEYAREGRMSPDWNAAPEGSSDWQPLKCHMGLPGFYDIQTPSGTRRMTRKEIEREYLLGTLPPSSLYEASPGKLHYVDVLVSPQAKAEHARLAAQKAPAAAAAKEDEWEKSNCSRGVYIGLALFLGGLGIHSFYAKREGEGSLHALLFFGTIVTLFGGFAPIAFILIAMNYIAILCEICSVQFDGDGCKLT